MLHYNKPKIVHYQNSNKALFSENLYISLLGFPLFQMFI